MSVAQMPPKAFPAFRIGRDMLDAQPLAHVPMNPLTIKVACSNCNLRELCMPVGLNEEQLQRIDEVVAVRRKVKRGGTLFRNG